MDYLKKGINSLQDAMRSKAYYKFGDAIANVIYCLAKARIAMALHGTLYVDGASKVSASILRDAVAIACNRSGQKIIARGGAHAKADIAEAIIGYGWTFELVTLDKCAELVAAPYIKKKPIKLREELDAFVEGFSNVLLVIMERALPKDS